MGSDIFTQPTAAPVPDPWAEFTLAAPSSAMGQPVKQDVGEHFPRAPQQAPPTAKDPWAEFTPAPTASATPAAHADPWAEFTPADSTAADVGKSGATGFVKGATGTIGLPGTVSDAVGNVSEYALQRVLKAVGLRWPRPAAELF